MTRPYVRLERRILEQVSGLSFSYADLRTYPWSSRPELRDLAHAARALRDDAWAVLFPDARENDRERRERVAVLEARHRLRVRVGLEEREDWRADRNPGFYPGDLAVDLRTVLAYDEAVVR